MWNKIQIIILMTIVVTSFISSWDGYDYDSGSYVEIDKGNLVRSGEEIEYYDYNSGEYKYADVESINSFGSSVEVEVYDSDTDTYRTFEMDGYRNSYVPSYTPSVSSYTKKAIPIVNNTTTPIEKFSLTVQKTPSNSRVRILNIKPTYYNGIRLKKGKYHIEVSKKGYETIDKWIDLKKNTNLNIELNKIQVYTSPQSIEHVTTHSVSKEMTKKERANYNSCIDGRYPSLCKHSWLTSKQAVKVKRAERRANYNSCIDGRYPSLCKHSWLTSKQAVEVKRAERRANYNSCIDGRYPSLCKHSWLTSKQAVEVKRAERRANYNSCIDGRYPSLCKHSWLTSEQAIKVRRAENREGN